MVVEKSPSHSKPASERVIAGVISAVRPTFELFNAVRRRPLLGGCFETAQPHIAISERNLAVVEASGCKRIAILRSSLRSPPVSCRWPERAS